MIKKLTNEKGFVIYKVTTSDYIILKAYNSLGGICDSCNAGINSGYYIPVMHYFMCKDCYLTWKEKAIYYDEDTEYEKMNMKSFEKMLKKLNLTLEVVIDEK